MAEGAPPSLGDLKRRLNDASPVDEAELLDMLNGAVAEYGERIGPLPDPLPANHREMILLDVVSLVSLTQRGAGFVEDDTLAGAGGSVAPITMYPRIRAYAKGRAASPLYHFPPAPDQVTPWL